MDEQEARRPEYHKEVGIVGGSALNLHEIYQSG